MPPTTPNPAVEYTVPLFIGVYPTGLVYADRRVDQAGDYKRAAFLPYDTLVLELELDCPADLLPRIIEDAAAMQARAGQDYRVSQSGQTIRLGTRVPAPNLADGSSPTSNPRARNEG